MNQSTKLEKVVLKIFKLRGRDDLKKITQEELDQKTREIIDSLKPLDLLKHTKIVYNRTAATFDSDDHIQGIVDELIVFINLLNENDLVLDLGCGNGRDTVFMMTSDLELKESLMQRMKDGKKTIERYSPPKKTLRIVALDSSLEMLKLTWKKMIRCKKMIKNSLILIRGDMHGLENTNGVAPEIYNGIWSCTSLLVHTPKELIEPAIKMWADCLLPKGKFYLSYIKEQTAGKYDKLLLSSTGNIKYFSHPSPNEIRKIAKKCGLKEIYFTINDFSVNSRMIKKNFFANHIFEKISKTRT